MKTTRAIFFLVLTLFSIAISANPVIVPQDSLRLYFQHDEEFLILNDADSTFSGFDALKIKAETGNFGAQRALAFYYMEGIDTKKDSVQAFYWFQKAAEQNDEVAEYNVGLCYSQGIGVEQDKEKAVEYFRRAARHGIVSAQYSLAMCYYEGDGVEKNYKEAFRWFDQAANADNEYAQLYLCGMYLAGQGIEKSHRKAWSYMKKVFMSGNRELQGIQIRAYNGKFSIFQEYDINKLIEEDKWSEFYGTKAEATKVQTRAKKREQLKVLILPWEFFVLIAIIANAFNLTLKRRRGERVIVEPRPLTIKKPVTTGENLYIDLRKLKERSQGDDAEAMCKLGDCYIQGDGVPINLFKAVELFRKAEALGNPLAQCRIGESYMNCWCVERDEKKAVEYFRKSAEQGCAEGQFQLGFVYLKGTGVEKDLEEAVKWFKLAAEHDHKKAQYCLGRCYSGGLGVEQNHGEAVKWMRSETKAGTMPKEITDAF